jgi:ATP-dependent DNA helicase RecG
MLRALEGNGSLPPLFETDADRSYFRVTFFIHNAFSAENNHVTPKPVKRRKKADVKAAVLDALSSEPLSSQDLAVKVGYSTHRSGAYFRIISELVEEGQIAYMNPDNPRDSNQRLCRVQ